MGRSLTNAMVNLGVDSEVEEALYEVSREYTPPVRFSAEVCVVI